MINIYSSSRYKLNKKRVKEHAQKALDGYQVGALAQVNIAFVGKRKMREIASQYKDEDVALPILAFSYLKERQETENLVGELIICYPQAILLAAERNKKVEDMMNQLIDHGMKNVFTK